MSYSKPHSDRPKKNKPPPRKSELERFAQSVVLDEVEDDQGFMVVTSVYVRRLTAKQREELKFQLGVFIGVKERQSATKQRWLNLGAGYWPDELHIGGTLAEFRATL